MDFDIVDRKKVLEAFRLCREQLPPGPHRDEIIQEQMGIAQLLMRSDARYNRARVHIIDRKKYMMAKLRYGF